MEQEGHKNTSCRHNLDMLHEHVLLRAQPKQRPTNRLNFHKQLGAFALHSFLSGGVIQNHFTLR